MALGGQIFSFAIALMAIVVIMALVYYVGPNRKQIFRRVFPGAVLATVLWLLSTWESDGTFAISPTTTCFTAASGRVSHCWCGAYILCVITLFGCAYNAVSERN